MANTEYIGADFRLNATKTWVSAGGTVTAQRETLFRRPTYASPSSVILTTAATVAIENAPTVSSGATITNPLAFWVQAGKTKFDGAGAWGGLQTGNAGLASGDLYVDTAANVLTNGDLVVARKV